MESVFLQLGLVLALASLFGYFVLKLKLPLVVAYLMVGVVISAVKIFDPGNSLVLSILPEIGIAFVLFLIGMELDLREVKSLGLPIIASAIGQIAISAFLGFFIATYLGFAQTESIFLGLGLSFSSTVVVVKMLLEKRDLSSLYGKLSIGILLVEDLVAILVLMLISVGGSFLNIGIQDSAPLLGLVLKAFGLFVLTFVLSKYVLKKVFDAVAKSVELLFFTAITWCFVFTSLAILAGFSVVIGAFLAGVALASSPYHLQIQGKIKPLRDFFLTLFFVYLGVQVNIFDFLGNLLPVFVFLMFALILKPFIYLLILSFFGFRKHTLFQTSLNLSQISEFSLILLLVGIQEGMVSEPALSIMAAVAVISIILSSIMVLYSSKLYGFFVPILKFFEHKERLHILEYRAEDSLTDHVVLVGAHRVGGPVVRFLQRSKVPFLVTDINPHLVSELREKGIKVIYGDIGDPEILDSLHLDKAKLIISTANSDDDNELLLEECKRKKSKARIVVRTEDAATSKTFKKMGADYVLFPEKVSGDYLVTQLKTRWL